MSSRSPSYGPARASETPALPWEQAGGALLERLTGAIDAAGDRPVRVAVRVRHGDACAWLARRRTHPKVYWRDREGRFEAAAAGAADLITPEQGFTLAASVELVHERLEAFAEPARYFGGVRFDPLRPVAEHWRVFGDFLWVLPRLEWLQTPAESYLIVHAMPWDGHECVRETEALLREAPPDKHSGAGDRALGTRRDAPGRAAWGAMVSQALAELDARRLGKVVLARESRYDHGGLALEEVACRLRGAARAAFIFGFVPSPGAAFCGASPERLYHRRRRDVTAEAIAGTRARGETPEEDAALARDLLASDKDRREHAFVVEAIGSALTPVCRSVETPDGPEVLQLSRCQHLAQRLTGELDADPASEAALLEGLHPTPAVGGTPREEALAWIRAREPFDRGWYAGPVGWIGRDEAEFAVALRSGLLTPDALRLYCGAGIVPGSEAESEWRELESKLAGFLAAMSAS
jgi:menaquinone-specific isochorismate synthase